MTCMTSNHSFTVHTVNAVKKKDLTWFLHKSVQGESKMAVEFSRRPLLSLLFSLWLSIFNLNSHCNWLEGQQAGTLLVGCAMPHRSQCAGSPLPLKKQFCCNAEVSPALDGLFFFTLACPSRLWWDKPAGILKRPLGRLDLWLWCITSAALLLNICHPVYRLHCLRKRP